MNSKSWESNLSRLFLYLLSQMLQKYTMIIVEKHEKINVKYLIIVNITQM